MKTQAGFTLIELILVTVIIGILAGMVVVNVSGILKKSQIKVAKGDISTYGSAVDRYALDHNDQYPQALSELCGGERNYIHELRPDPWGNQYLYQPPSSTDKGDYQISSSGPDGQPGTEDDVTSTSKAE